MFPLTIVACQTLQNLLVSDSALEQAIAALATSCDVQIPLITTDATVLSSASPDLGDKSLQLIYPRVCLYSTGLKNLQIEKFRTLSGSLAIVAEIWASANLVQDADQWIHFYVEAITSILRENIGDWGNGMFFSGIYDVQIQQPKVGGLGYVESAKLTCSLNVSGS